MNFSRIRDIVIEQGNIIKIVRKDDGVVLWEKRDDKITITFHDNIPITMTYDSGYDIEG